MIRLYRWCCAALALSAVASPVFAQGNDDYVVDLRCEPVADSEYAASVSGRLFVTGYQSHRFNVSGSMEASLIAHGDTDSRREAAATGVFGFNGAGGEIFFRDEDAFALFLLNITSSDGAPNAGRSVLTGKDHVNYDTDCSASSFRLPSVPDLVPANRLRTWRIPGTYNLQMWLDVTNDGNATMVAPAPIRVVINGTEVRTNWQAGTTLRPGETSQLSFESDMSTFQRCREYSVRIDVDQQLQPALFDTYSNDTVIARTSCLGWNTVIDEFSLGGTLSGVMGKTLKAIVSSQKSGRTDGKLCMECHTGRDSAGDFKVLNTNDISPTQLIGGSTWASNPGLVDWFNDARPNGQPKPEALKILFSTWRSDGARD